MPDKEGTSADVVDMCYWCGTGGDSTYDHAETMMIVVQWLWHCFPLVNTPFKLEEAFGPYS